MVLFERAMIELSSLTASVTLLPVSRPSKNPEVPIHIHQLVGLLLLLEDGGRCVILVLALSARDIAASRVSRPSRLR